MFPAYSAAWQELATLVDRIPGELGKGGSTEDSWELICITCICKVGRSFLRLGFDQVCCCRTEVPPSSDGDLAVSVIMYRRCALQQRAQGSCHLWV